jgi:ureidoglycolate dehydrogenase (NAD+)
MNHLSLQDLTRFTSEVFQHAGMRAADANQVAELLVWADARGVPSHGVSRIGRYLDFIERGDLDAQARPEVASIGPAAAMVHAARAAGPVAMVLACSEAVRRARTQAIGLCIVEGTTHVGAVGYYCARIAAEGCAALVSVAGTPNMAYAGTRVPAVSTAPLAMAVPGAAGDPDVVFDMASSVIGVGKLRQARRSGDPLPPGAALDKDGRPTTDAEAASVLLPVGGAKGAGLALMIELLTGALAGSPILSPHILGASTRHSQNALVVAIDIAAFRPLEAFRADVGSLQGALRGLPLQQGVDEVRMPGQRGARSAEMQRHEGVRLSAKMHAELAQLAQRFALRPPAPQP